MEKKRENSRPLSHCVILSMPLLNKLKMEDGEMSDEVGTVSMSVTVRNFSVLTQVTGAFNTTTLQS